MMKFLQKVLFPAMLLCFTTISMAQNKVISGKVVDEKGVPIVKSSVLVSGTKLGTSTNEEGKFTLSVPLSAQKLVITSLNFQKGRYRFRTPHL